MIKPKFPTDAERTTTHNVPMDSNMVADIRDEQTRRLRLNPKRPKRTIPLVASDMIFCAIHTKMILMSDENNHAEKIKALTELYRDRL